MTKEEKQELEEEIEKLKKDLDAYPILGVTEKEKERVINQHLDDILKRRKRLKEE